MIKNAEIEEILSRNSLSIHQIPEGQYVGQYVLLDDKNQKVIGVCAFTVPLIVTARDIDKERSEISKG